MTDAARSAQRRELIGHLAIGLSAFGGGLCAIVLVGWITGAEIATSFVPGYVSMKANAAVALLLLAFGVATLARPSSVRFVRIAAAVAVTLAAAVAGLTLVQDVFAADFGIDEAIVRDPDVRETGAPGRMAPQTAAGILLAALAVALMRRGSPLSTAWGEALAIVVTAIAFVGITGYLAGVEEYVGFAQFTEFALPTALTLGAIGIALIFSQPERGVARVLTADTAGGGLARSLLPAALLLPLVLTGLRLFGARAGFFTRPVGLMAYNIALVLLFTLLVVRVALQLDRTDRERRDAEAALRESERRFRTIFEESPAGMALLSPSLRVERANAAFGAILAADAADIAGRPFAEFVHAQDPVIDAASRLLKGDGRLFRDEVRLLRTMGDVVWVDLAIVALDGRDGVPGYGLGIGYDVTPRKRAEQDLREQHARLEALARELRASNQSLEAFTYTVSHDLRAPLRGVEFYAEVLAEDHAASWPEDAKDALSRLSRDARRMGQLIEDLLELARSTNDPLSLEEVDLAPLALDVVAQLRERETNERRVDFAIEGAPDALVARADRALVRVVLENLIGNAWKYTTNVPEARVVFGATRGQGEYVYFVRDNGVGFDPAEASNLFQPFTRLSSSRGFQGSGIGLATVKRIVLRHGGRVWADATPGVGATFFFTLPDPRRS